MINRTLDEGLTAIELFSPEDIGETAVAWLALQARPDMILLAHADDGVIWGRVADDGLTFPPPSLLRQAAFRDLTLQKARLFNEQEELFLWRIGEKQWRARRITDGQGDAIRYYDEPQVLWGTQVEASEDGFSRLAEGIQGLRHAPPVSLPVENWDRTRLYLGVRHYLERGEEGELRVKMSRLTHLWRK
jgi:CRISPR-associated protein (TIGR03984 family)